MTDQPEQPQPDEQPDDTSASEAVEAFYQYYRAKQPVYTKYALTNDLEAIRNALAYDLVAVRTHRERNINNREILRSLVALIERIESARLDNSEIPM